VSFRIRKSNILNQKLKSRLVKACVVVVALLCLLTGRLVWVEVMHGSDLSAEARSHYEHKQILPGQRGRIYDRNGELLARNQTVYTLVVDCYQLRDQGLARIGLAKKEGTSRLSVKKRYLPEEVLSRYREYVVECLSKPLRVPKHELGKSLKGKKTGEIILAKNIEDDFARELDQVLKENSIGGLYLRKGQRRYYPSPLSLTQVIGYVREIDEEKGGKIIRKIKGIEGIEKTFNEQMEGESGFRYCERDRRRREILAYRGETKSPVPGKDVYLTIDMELQSIVENELDAVVEKYRPEKVTAIWMKPATGEILAMASRPHFNLESRSGVRRNIAISDLYQPGSTFKIVGYAGAFDRNLANPSTPIDCHMGKYDLEGFELHDHHDYGVLPASMAFAKSSNIGAYMIARPLNRDVFHSYIEKFGFGRKTGIELSAEVGGANQPVSKWSDLSFSSKVMGYEIAVSPLQMAVACGVIANNGIYKGPTVLKGIKGRRDRRPRKDGEPEERRVVSERSANQVRQCMIRVMSEEGTGTKASIPGYTIAAKTGTARKHVENIGYVKGRYTVSFMGFFPAHNPELLGLIVIDDPHSDGQHLYGGTVAAPVYKNIAEKAAKLMGIQPDRPEEIIEMKRLTEATGGGVGALERP